MFIILGLSFRVMPISRVARPAYGAGRSTSELAPTLKLRDESNEADQPQSELERQAVEPNRLRAQNL